MDRQRAELVELVADHLMSRFALEEPPRRTAEAIVEMVERSIVSRAVRRAFRLFVGSDPFRGP